MKKWFLSTLVVLSLAGCNETDDLISIDTLGTTSPKQSQLRSYEEAKFIALQSISILDSDYDNSVTTRGISSQEPFKTKPPMSFVQIPVRPVYQSLLTTTH